MNNIYRPAIRCASLVCASIFLIACSKAPSGSDMAAADVGVVKEWSKHGGTDAEQRFSPLKQITPSNIENLGLAWAFDLGVSRGIESTPLVVDGVIYVTATWNKVSALDAKTGELRWQYDPKVDRSKAADLCCDAVNRGVAYSDGKIITGTIDGRLLALDADTGKVLWDVVTVDQSKPYTITGAPRIVNGKAIIGNGGAEYGVRGYFSAYDINTGEMVWRFYTVPGNPADGFESPAMAKAAETWKGEWWKYGGGGTAWDSMAYDAELDLLYIGVGNGSPWNQNIRSPGGGDNLYLSSIVAVRPDTGEYVWHYQTTPGETWDYTATQHMILAELDIAGETRKVIMQAPKNGFFYVIDRETGELLSAKNYVPVNWATHIDQETGRPVEIPEARWGGKAPHLQLPGPLGGHNWHPMSFSPDTGLVYIPAMETPFVYADDKNFSFNDSGWNTGADGAMGSLPTGMAQFKAIKAAIKGSLLAWDPVKQQPAWEIPHKGTWNGGILSTAGGLVFQGNADAKLVAYRADNGERLWDFFAQTGIVAPPISYEIDGEQYIAVASGWGGTFALLYGGLLPADGDVGVGRLMVFKLGAKGALPELPTKVLARPEPPESTADAETIAKGKQIYDNRCVVCHGDHVISSGLVPDLRWSPLLIAEEAIQTVVLGGALTSQGMPSFSEVLNEDDIKSLRAYIISAAHEGLEEKLDIGK
ncbi:Quinohemoprotein alcohol dehydrogenase ADH IIB [Zhongshania aliphaticivorans]|uniref:Quinohemoprotein alcohol dehydrogenase ADH IIB n=1 Tax=Zhongshania aliphaticivorans TaxID=1470434 RepID=A0A5S9PIA8_9GAMM|nr:PQQ-dependent dehydrogenase, methanol/ethanol family [Zhongshania aliphaticivorans]CAA0103788.1 Quinohemoprotein alcohol dehydrogenase ADH IIB [Zhongshania aliphaticivorans]